MRAEFDYGMIIWVIFFIITFVVSGIEKRRNAQKKAEEQQQFPPVTADFPPVATELPKTSQNTSATGRKRPNFTIHKDSQESLNLPETLGRPESLERTDTESRFFSTSTVNPTNQTSRKGKKNNTANHIKSTPEISEDKVMATENPNDEVSDRFNLRDAVIFSEILKPKFDE